MGAIPFDAHKFALIEAGGLATDCGDEFQGGLNRNGGFLNSKCAITLYKYRIKIDPKSKNGKMSE